MKPTMRQRHVEVIVPAFAADDSKPLRLVHMKPLGGSLFNLDVLTRLPDA